MTDSDITPGEISRSLARIENTVNNLALSVQASMTTAAAQSVKLENEAKRTDDLVGKSEELTKKVDSLLFRSAFISGGISVLGAIAEYLFGRHA